MAIEVASPAPVREVVTPLKISEAMRLGCLLAPEQGFGHLFEVTRFTTPRKACAVGAAIIGGIAHDDERFRLLASVPCPVPGCKRAQGGPFVKAILNGDLSTPAHLNDHHQWKRERIADWLAGHGF